FFKRILTYITNKQAPSDAVKRKAPGIAEAVSPDLRQSAAGNEGIVGRNAILESRTGGVHVNPHHFSQQYASVLAIAKRVSSAAAVTQSKVQKTIRAKGQLTGLVIGKVADLIYGKQYPLACGIGQVGIGSQDRVLSYNRLKLPAQRAVVIQIKFSTLRKIRMEGQAKQSHFVLRDDFTGEFQNGLWQSTPVPDTSISPALFDAKEPATAATGLLHTQRSIKV